MLENGNLTYEFPIIVNKDMLVVDGQHILTSDHIMSLERFPRSLVILGAGVLAWGSAMLRGSVVATVIAGVLLVFGGALLIAARREV